MLSDIYDWFTFYKELIEIFNIKGGAASGKGGILYLIIKQSLIISILIGMLSNIGERQMFSLGKRLKETYIDKYKFLPETYAPNLV